MTEFVIVVEVDNKRAQEAYAKGLRDLELIWPQLMLTAEKFDSAKRQANEARRAKLETEMDEYKAQIEAHKEWANAPKLFRGPEPKVPFFPPAFCYFPFMNHMVKDSYQSIRDELESKLHLASAATRPFQMTEYQVKDMVGWETGRRIERLKEDCDHN